MLDQLENLRVIEDLDESGIDQDINEWDADDIRQLNKDMEGPIEPAERQIVRRLALVPVSLIVPNIEQPRWVLFENKKEFNDLVNSIKARGNVIRPIIVVPYKKGFMLKDGQRRLTAIKATEIKDVYSIIEYYIGGNGSQLPTPKIEMLEDAIISNLHQRKMMPLEEARAYKRWLDITNTTMTELAGRVGKGVPEISSILKLLKLEQSLQEKLATGKISRVLGVQLASYPEEAQKEIYREYKEILEKYDGKIPSPNASEWISKTIKKIAESKKIEPLRRKKAGALKTHAQMVFNSIIKSIKRMDDLLDELSGLSDEELFKNKDMSIQTASKLGLLQEKIEDVHERVT